MKKTPDKQRRVHTREFMVRPGDVDGFAVAVARLMADSELRARFTARVIEARERFGIETIAAKWEELFGHGRSGDHPRRAASCADLRLF